MSGRATNGPVRRAPLGDAGFILIEVMVAMVLLALLVVPLFAAAQVSAGRAESVRERTTTVGADQGIATQDAWRWACGISSAWWKPGPTLFVDVGQKQTEKGESGSPEAPVPDAPAVGIWGDGWFLGEWQADAAGRMLLGASVWRDLSGTELAIRARRMGEVWGPPWRLVVPEADGTTVSSGRDAGALSGATMVHAPALGAPSLGANPESGPSPVPVTPGLLFALPGSNQALNGLELDVRRQSWSTEAGREIDVYF